jgi:hypothetical protein
MVESALENNSIYLLIASVAISIAITLPRFGPGIPMSVDTTSHLYRVLFYSHWMQSGVFPFWSPDWYAGSPAILLYPPLGYYFALGLTAIGLDPLLAYKIVDAFFYSIAPIAIFFLARELGFAKGESALGALFFSLVPEVVENYVFFDRFPTVISVPIFCAFIIAFNRALMREGGPLSIMASILTMSALLLTHHLSALIAGFAAVIMVILAIGKHGVKKPILTLGAVVIGTLGLTAFWLVPLIISLKEFPQNPFYNRNVIFPFLRFTYFGFDVTSYLLGIAQFVLAAVAVQSILGRTFKKHLPINAVLFFPVLLAGMAFFQAGEMINSIPLSDVGVLIVAVSFVFFLGQFIIKPQTRKLLLQQNGTLFAILWFLVFLWLGLGFYALPVLWVEPLTQFWTKTMDVYRIWLYLALPMCAIAARGFLRSIAKLWPRRPLMPLILIALAVTPISVSIALKEQYAFVHTVNGVLPYNTSNAEIPASLLDYFRNDSSQGRILGINVPFWIYVLPNYVSKPIVDGWYPQTKLVTQLVNISDYRIDDLETALTPEARVKVWKTLIDSAQELDITWVIIGSPRLAYVLMGDSNFTQQLSVSYSPEDLLIYKINQPPSYVEDVGVNAALPEISRPNPDRIILDYATGTPGNLIILKEAYFPTWVATADGQPIMVQRDPSTGYILLNVPAGARQVAVFQKTNSAIWNITSAISTFLWLALTAALLLRRHRARR